jgi:5-deoxy-glucuronate isomerase
LVSPGVETRLIGLRLVRLEAGERAVLNDDGEQCAVVLGGMVEVSVSGSALGLVGGRSDVFDGSGDAVYVPPGQELALEADSAAVVAVAAAPLDGRTSGATRLISSGEQRVAGAGSGNWSRSIRTVLGPDDEAGRLIVGETVNPSGNWSSYPPHKHDRQDPPREVALEEVYFYRLKPEGGFAVQIVYGDGKETARIVRDGDVIAISSGYHPVVVAPGYELYYLWVMAGEGRELVPYFDPKHAWVQDLTGD